MVPSIEPRGSVRATGFPNLSEPTGGCAYGTPRYSKTAGDLALTPPFTGPEVVSTTGTAGPIGVEFTGELKRKTEPIKGNKTEVVDNMIANAWKVFSSEIKFSCKSISHFPNIYTSVTSPHQRVPSAPSLFFLYRHRRADLVLPIFGILKAMGSTFCMGKLCTNIPEPRI